MYTYMTVPHDTTSLTAAPQLAHTHTLTLSVYHTFTPSHPHTPTGARTLPGGDPVRPPPAVGGSGLPAHRREDGARQRDARVRGRHGDRRLETDGIQLLLLLTVPV